MLGSALSIYVFNINGRSSAIMFVKVFGKPIGMVLFVRGLLNCRPLFSCASNETTLLFPGWYYL